MSQPEWTFAAYDASGQSKGTISLASQRSVSVQLNGPSALTFTLPVTSGEAAKITPGSTFIKAWRRAPGASEKALRFYGVVWVVEEAGAAGFDAIRYTCFDPMVYLGRRFTTAAYSVAVDQGTIIKEIIDSTNTAYGDTGILTTANTVTTGVTRTTNWADSKLPLLDVIGQFGGMLDGCDTWLDPMNYDAGKIAALNVALVRGSYKPAAAFEYGPSTLANCTGMTRVRSMDNVFNDVLGYTDTASSNWTNATSISAYKRLQADIGFPDVTDANILSARTKGYLDYHETPDAIAATTLSAGPGAPRVWDAFNVGDTVPVRFAKGSVEFSSVQRVYGVDIEISDNGVESASTLEVRAA